MLEEFRLASCKGKQSFDTWELADRVAKRHHKRRIVYHCDICHKFHLATARHYGTIRKMVPYRRFKKCL